MSEPAKITPYENGPLGVKNGPKLRMPDGAELEIKGALCRCGLSANKPFCDGSHTREGWESTNEGVIRNTPIDYTGTVDGVEVTVSYTPVLCTHAAECQRLALNVFNPKEKPWIQPENGSLKEIMDVMVNCPSGALRVSVGDNAKAHMTPLDLGIRVEKNGPYHVSNLDLDAKFNGAEASRGKYSLCRCGLSKNKPFCDGSHYEQGWKE